MYLSDLQHPSASLQSKLETLYALRGSAKIDLVFSTPYLNLLSKLGNPHLNIPPTIHVAGTNGKGSTVAIMRACLEAAGYKTHTYTSPHLVFFNERIRLAGALVDNDTLEKAIDEILDINNGEPLSFFEATSAITFNLFAQTPADFTLLEVGLGGRLDCTNVIETPALTVITPIDLDHTEYLGTTLSAIAREKAGIIKPGIPCITAPQAPEVLEVLKSAAKEKNAPLIIANADQTALIQKHLSLKGAHQLTNAQTALTALETLRPSKLKETATIKGLQSAVWPARLQPLPKLLPAPWHVWLDGGHNPAAAKILADFIKNTCHPAPAYAIIGMMDHKDSAEFLKTLLTQTDGVITTTIAQEPKAKTAESLAAEIKNISPDKLIGQATTPIDALNTLKENYQPGHIIICGSLYLAGQVLQNLSR